jgi:hypothetical protein
VTQTSIELEKLPFASLTREKLDFILVHQHERNHFEEYFSSPLGLLVFRCYLVLSSTLNWLFHKYFKPGELGGEALADGSFRSWLKRDALGWISSKIESGQLVVEGGLRTLGYLESEVLPEIDVISEFLALLMGRREGVTMGEFANVANLAFAQLEKRGAIPKTQRWTTRRPNSPLHPDMDPILTGTELFELSALSAELAVLREIGAPKEEVSRWAEGYSEAPYLAPLRVMKQAGINFDLHAHMARVAFRSPFDPVIGSSDTLLVETHHPTWRYRNQLFIFADQRNCHRGLSAYERRIAFDRRVSSGESMEAVLCEMALETLPSLANLWGGRAFPPLVGMASNLLSTPDEVPKPFDARRGVQATLRRFEICLRYAADQQDDELRSVKEQIVYRDDLASFPSLEKGEDILDLLGYHSAGVSGYLQLSNFLEGIEAAYIPPFGDSVYARLRRLLGELPGHMSDSVSVARIAVAVFGSAYAKAVGLA